MPEILTRHSILCLISSLLLFFGVRAAAYSPLPAELDGSMMPLDTARFSPFPALPDSLKPVFGVYISRHGARYLSGPKKIDNLLNTLTAARQDSLLSDTGKAFLDLLHEIYNANSTNWGQLTPTGIAEQHIMGERIYNILTPLHEATPRVRAVSSFVPRCVMTMYQFNWKLDCCNDSISVATDEGHQFDPLLCCFTADKEYAAYRDNGDWKEVYEDFVNHYISPEPARQLFKTTPLSDEKLRKLTLDMYEVLKANRAAGLPAPSTQWMSENQYRDCWKASNLVHYLRNSITPLSSLAAQATKPLAEAVINDLDAPRGALKAYFGHAETLMPLFSLLRIEGTFALPLDYEQLDEVWKIQEIVPLGANLLILMSENPLGIRYVSLQLNGHTVIPIPGASAVVPWSELKDYWTHLIAATAD